ncbi:hypothetical protein BV898_02820 [Hypsibius exemplaris]|uniref:HTH CENPB-type domain-containing protein n=1 Tax=Hypsibius exemplaris TaxID=2072580 RepID=A0A1W0X7I4_HYPEX|nr:hypothetical protein BV898_02820 [Hypsibius exemplaris]
MAVALNPTKKKAKCLTISEKLEVLNDLDSTKMNGSGVANKYGVNKATVSRIKAQGEKLRLEFRNNHNLRLKRLPRRTTFNEINSRMEDFIMERFEGRESPLTGPMLQAKARQFAAELGFPDFKASDGWLQSFRARRLITLPTAAITSTRKAQPDEADFLVADVSRDPVARLLPATNSSDPAVSDDKRTSRPTQTSTEAPSNALVSCQKGIQTDNAESSIQGSVLERNKALARSLISAASGTLTEAPASITPVTQAGKTVSETIQRNVHAIHQLLPLYGTIKSLTFEYFVLEFIESEIIGQVARCWRKGTNDIVAIKIVQNSSRSNQSVEADLILISESFQYEDCTCYVLEVVRNGTIQRIRTAD